MENTTFYRMFYTKYYAWMVNWTIMLQTSFNKFQLE